MKETEFQKYCRVMYDDNCIERWEHGDKPYETFTIYYTTHSTWLKQQFKEKETYATK